MRKYFKKVWFWLLIIFIVLPTINYCVFDFGSLAFCDYKSIVGDNLNLTQTYDLLKVAAQARKNGVQTDVRYLSSGVPQLSLTAHHLGAEYRALLRYSGAAPGKIFIVFSDGHEKAACLTPNLWIRLYMWKMFKDSGVETGWLWHTWIHHVIYWGPG